MGGRTFIGEAIEGASLGRRIRDLLLGDATSNFVVAIAIVIGFFHGYLKLKFRHPLVTFAFDIPLILALAITVSRMKGLADFMPPGRTGRVMRIFYAVTGIYFLLSLVLPWGAPMVVALAAVRGWLFATLMFGLGYHLIVSRRQLHAYFLLIIILSAITAFYATRQTLEEVLAMEALDPYYEFRLRGVRDVDNEGNLVLRRFSTFISSGAFGGTMAVALLFLAALVTDRKVPVWERLLLLGLGAVIGWGLFLSGSRTSLIALVIGLAFILWFRRLRPDLLLLVVIGAVGFYLGSRGVGGGVTDRFTRFELGGLWGRFYIVWAPGVSYLLKSGFIGGGLGKAVVGLPAFLFPLMGTFEVWGVDGDLGKVMAEMGVAGTIVIFWLLIVGLQDVAKIAMRHRLDSTGTMAMGAGACFIGTVLTFPTGSPFLGIPLGVLSWFFLGAVVRLDQIDARAEASGGEAASAGAGAGAVATAGGAGRRIGRTTSETTGSLTQNLAKPNPREGRERLFLHYKKGDAPPVRPAGPPPKARPFSAAPSPQVAPTPVRMSSPPQSQPSRPNRRFLYEKDIISESRRRGGRKSSRPAKP